MFAELQDALEDAFDQLSYEQIEAITHMTDEEGVAFVQEMLADYDLSFAEEDGWFSNAFSWVKKKAKAVTEKVKEVAKKGLDKAKHEAEKLYKKGKNKVCEFTFSGFGYSNLI